MVKPANKRGWGKGWPKNRSADMTWVTAPLSGTRWQVHREIAPLLLKAVTIIEERGYLFDLGPRDINDDWGYSNRPIRGTRIPSNHSWGLAIDIDAQNYPQGQRRKVPPLWVREVFALCGFAWGGTWSYADPMHFEFQGTLADARSAVSRLNSAGIVQPDPDPAPAPVPPAALPVREAMFIGTRGRMVEIVQWEISAVSGAQFPGEIGTYWGMLKEAIVNIGRITGNNWDGTFIGPDQWRVIDMLYMSKGHQPVLQ